MMKKIQTFFLFLSAGGVAGFALLLSLQSTPKKIFQDLVYGDTFDYTTFYVSRWIVIALMTHAWYIYRYFRKSENAFYLKISLWVRVIVGFSLYFLMFFIYTFPELSLNSPKNILETFLFMLLIILESCIFACTVIAPSVLIHKNLKNKHNVVLKFLLSCVVVYFTCMTMIIDFFVLIICTSLFLSIFGVVQL